MNTPDLASTLGPHQMDVTDPTGKLLDWHQARRVQGVPTLSVLAGPIGLGVRAWRAWAGSRDSPVSQTARADAAGIISDWIEQVIGTGDLTARIALRDRDLFQDEAAQMNASITALRGKVAAARQLADQLRQTHLKGGDTAPLIGQLHAALTALRTGEDG